MARVACKAERLALLEKYDKEQDNLRREDQLRDERVVRDLQSVKELEVVRIEPEMFKKLHEKAKKEDDAKKDGLLEKIKK